MQRCAIFLIIEFDVTGAKWDWIWDPPNVDGPVEFIPNHKVQWADDEAEGSWNLSGDTLYANFDGRRYVFKFVNEDEMILIDPQRNPPTKIFRKGL